jgi:thiol-disulfide isomerase/thioredoxin
MTRPLVVLFLSAALASANIVNDVRAAIAKDDFKSGDQLLKSYRASAGITPEWLEALSWMSRGELAAKHYDEAEKYATETHDLSVAELKKRPLDREQYLPIALGAAIEVEANVLAARNQRSEAVSYLQDQLKTYYSTSIRTRIQKNLNLLNMEGKPAPAIQNVLLPKGKPVLVFFWAHWCNDCKAEGPILARLKTEFGPQGLELVAPTQKYGYVAEGQEAPADVELRYIEKIRQERYADIITTPAPVSEENFRRYGASTTPTLVLIDRKGIVRLYHPGRMTYEELRPLIEKLVRPSAS